MTSWKDMPFGIDSDGKPLAFDFAGTQQHVLAAGRSRAGKSNWLYSVLPAMVAQGCVIVGSDPTGILLTPYVAATPDGWIVTKTDPAAVERMLSWAVRLMDERIQEGVRAKKREKIPTDDPAYPHIFIVMEEWGNTVRSAKVYDQGQKPADRVSGLIEAHMNRLAAEALKANMSILLIIQKASADVLLGIRDQLAVRCSFAQPTKDSAEMIDESITRENAERMQKAKPGVGYWYFAGEEPVWFRAPLASYEQYFDTMEKHYRGRPDVLPHYESAGGNDDVSE